MNIDPRERPDRDGKKLLAVHAHEPVRRAVKILAAEQGTTNVALLYEAVGLLLTAHGKSVPAEIDIELADQQRQRLCVTLQALAHQVTTDSAHSDDGSDRQPDLAAVEAAHEGAPRPKNTTHTEQPPAAKAA